MAAGSNQVREGEDEASPKGATLGRPSDEGEAVARDRRIDPRSGRMHENESGQQRELRKTVEVARRMKRQCGHGLLRGAHRRSF